MSKKRFAFPYGDTSFIAGTNQKEVKLKEYRYTGKEKDDATGLYYHGARYYASWLGRWLSADPLFRENPSVYERERGGDEEEQERLDDEYQEKLYGEGLSLYCYCTGNPVKFSDPSGMGKDIFAPVDTGLGIAKDVIEHNIKYHSQKYSTTRNPVKRFYHHTSHVFSEAVNVIVPRSRKEAAKWVFTAGGAIASRAGIAIEKAAVFIAKKRKVGRAILNKVDDTYRAARNSFRILRGQRRRGCVTFSDEVSVRKQIRHLKGTAPSDKSYLDSFDDAQAVLNAYKKGNYRLISQNPAQNTVTIEVKGITGTYVNVGNPRGLPDLSLPTNKFMIQSSKAPKVVPVNPNK